ncbi:D-alanyl-D-alanine carboxypeptidase (penicillin-binding protein 5/6) [Desulfohalotomaculum tongense]|uniref:D-alanyl-D-alanine carboxypeptidase family protein n=1 Tax=Desulforadius tongensis TaxID=1216062 RepID=UPI00195A08AD|nr:D-alanyl-D-alanine carboxypeptidase family protein [Desulforadius tongensis]MBM7855924.1 D-alanyl-D-alanine carboxypeptidase (penicillin-binding protein 5/6) [Desulforadius tongensis]
MNFIRIIAVGIVILIQLVAVESVQAEEPQLVGEAAILIDAESGQVLYQKNAHKPMYPASTTKILTALVALEQGELDDVITVSENAVKTKGSAIWLKEGEQLTLEDMLYALMLNSANDAAVAIAEHFAGTVEQFSLQMNETARRLGAKNTHFTNPHGLPDEEHYTTAYDLAVITRYAMQNKNFARIVNTKTKTIKRGDPEDFKLLINHNRLLWKYRYAIGVKTGYTTKARQCIVAAARRDNRELIAVVLKTEGINIWTDAIRLLDYGFNNFKKQKVIGKGEIINRTEVKYVKEKIPLVSSKDVYYNFPVDHRPDLKRKVKLAAEPAAPLEKNAILGQLLIYDGSRQIAAVELLSGQKVERPLNTYWWYRAVPVLIILLAAVFILRVLWKIKTKKIRIRRRR